MVDLTCMGKVTFNVQVDEELLAKARARGVDPDRALDAWLRDALEDRKPFRLDLNASAREKAADPEGSRRRARAWAEGSRDYLDALRRWTEENGVFGEEWRTW